MALQHSSGDLLADRRYRYAEGCLAEGDFAAAAELAEQALEIAPRYAPAWLLLGRARDALAVRDGDRGQREAAVRALGCALDIDPDDRLGARAHLARLARASGDAGALSPAYLRALFDGYAPRFDRHLVEGLGYVGPELLRAALPAAPARFGTALDLGCGTGLMGAGVRDRVDYLAGVDLSPGMLALARAKAVDGRPLYDRLAQGDLVGFLADEPEASADLCLAADVLIYAGDLGPALSGMARALRPGGLAAFTVQSPEDDAGGRAGEGFALGADGRYAHADAHVAAAAAAGGLEILTLRPAGVRRENGRPVPGRVVVTRRSGG